MPDEKDFNNCVIEELDLFTEFLEKITCNNLAVQMRLFIILITEASSEAEAKRWIVSSMKWLAKFREKSVMLKNQVAISEADSLARKFRLECLVFKVPFFWENQQAYSKPLIQNKKAFKGIKTINLRGLIL